DLFQKPEVFYRKRELPRAAFQEVNLLPGPMASTGMSDQEQAHGRFTAHDWNDYELPNLLGREAFGGLDRGFGRPLDDGSALFPHLRDLVADRGEAGITQKLRRQPGRVCRD